MVYKYPKQSAIKIDSGNLSFGSKNIWRDLSITIERGEFIAVLGPNGSGKTSFLQVLLGLQRLSSGNIKINGNLPAHGNKNIGYIPQQKSFDYCFSLRGRDLVKMGLDGHKLGFTFHGNKDLIDKTLKKVGALEYGDIPLGVLSGGQQQRIRIAQSLVSNPDILLCDEPFSSLDTSAQIATTNLINTYRQNTNSTVIFVTHKIDSILPYVSRILYFANGKWIINTPEKILQDDVLSELYQTHVDVVNVHGHVHIIVNENISVKTGERYHQKEVK